MAKAATTAVNRAHPLEGRQARGAKVTLAPADPAFRLALRVGTDAVAAAGKALGITLPTTPKTSSEKGTRAALWLGPDEWLVMDTGTKDPMADLAELQVLHSAVDISHRNTAILVSGEGAAAILNAGCPQDLSLRAFPAGACSRSVLGKIEVVLWRTSEVAFRVECWRSFSDYAFTFLSDAARDTAL